MPERLTDARIDELFDTYLHAPSIRSLLEEVQRERLFKEYAVQHLRFHASLAAECDNAGTDFARGRSCGIMGTVEDIKSAIARAEKEGKNR